MSHRQGSLDLPRAFGPYQLLKQVAVGGMAEVYLARTRGIGGFEKLTALKMIHPRYSEDEHFVQMLVEEAKISVLLNHVNVAQTFDLGCIDGTYFITMEFVEGADAYRVMRRASELGVQIPIETCIYVASEVCAGIDYAHRKRDADGRPLSIIHRDISPQNILISFTGEVKVVDFGIAKAALRSQETEAGVIKGKYYYMSPEQAWGDPVDQRTDIFSTGVILYELLTGQMLYLEDNISMLLDRVRKAEIDPPTLRREDIPQELSEITMKALAKYPEERFATASAMGQALTRLLYRLAPDYTPTRVAQLMGWLFEPEIKRGTTGVKLPSGERSLGSTQDEAVRPIDVVQHGASVLFGDAAPSVPKPAAPLPPRPKGGRELPPSVEAQAARPRGRDPSAPTAALPVPGGGVARASPAAGRAAPRRAEPEPGESGERRRNADQPTSRMTAPSAAKLAAPAGDVMQRLSELPGFDSGVAAADDDGDPTEMWENETLVDDDGRFDKFIQDLRGAKSSEGLPVPSPASDTAPRDQPDMDEATYVMSSMDDGVTLTGDVRSPFARPDVRVSGAVSVTDSSQGVGKLDAEAATRGHALPKPAVGRQGPAAPGAKPAGAPPPATARPAQAPQRAVAAAPQPRAPANTAPWPPPAIAAAPAPPTPPSPVVAWPAPQPAPYAPPPIAPPVPGAADPFVVGVQSAVETAAYSAVDGPKPRRYLLLWALVGLLTLGVVALALVLFGSPDEPAPALEIVSVPAGAAVALDQRAVAGTTPLTLRDGLVAGQTHRVEVRLPGYAVWGTSIVASAGLVRQIAILAPLRGKLRIETDPPTAQVFVDGSYRGSTPLVLNDVEAARELSIRITRPGYAPESRTVRLGDQLDQTLRLTLTPGTPGTGSR